jgi:hypothetical protein
LIPGFGFLELNPTFATLINYNFRDVAQPGSALAWGARGRWFESSRPDKTGQIGFYFDLSGFIYLKCLTGLQSRQIETEKRKKVSRTCMHLNSFTFYDTIASAGRWFIF